MGAGTGPLGTGSTALGSPDGAGAVAGAEGDTPSVTVFTGSAAADAFARGDEALAAASGAVPGAGAGGAGLRMTTQ